MLPEDVIGSIESVVRESGRRVRGATGFTVSTKGTRENLVTSADIENERFLKEKLTALIPGSAFVGEEGDDSSTIGDGYTWIVDPIDGTANFSRGIPMSGISVALFRGGAPWIGIVHNPFTGTLWKAEAGRGAWKDGVPMHVSDRAFRDAIMCTAWCSYRKELSPPCFKLSSSIHPEINDIRRIGTAACELCMMAEGAVELYFEARLSPWDYAAALICLKEAGGCFRSIEGDVVYDRPCPVVAANSQENLGRLMAYVEEAFGGRNPC